MGVVGTNPVTRCHLGVGITIIGQNVAYMAVLASADLQGYTASHLQPQLAVTLGQ